MKATGSAEIWQSTGPQSVRETVMLPSAMRPVMSSPPRMWTLNEAVVLSADSDSTNGSIRIVAEVATRAAGELHRPGQAQSDGDVPTGTPSGRR